MLRWLSSGCSSVLQKGNVAFGTGRREGGIVKIDVKTACFGGYAWSLQTSNGSRRGSAKCYSL